jgi:4-amino-4-deoxy-L-arabinose transferase-like glycosyltransferase
MAVTNAPARRANAPVALAARISIPRWSRDAWLSIGVVALYLGITTAWLAIDHSIPIYDAGLHLSIAMSVYEHIGSGDFGEAFHNTIPYPPFTYLVGSLGLLIGGFGVMQMILTENLVFVPLLALGCYNIGRLAFSARAGLLAVVFALGSPLILAQFHVFMTDAPETAMVAFSVWLIIATERFSRQWVSAAAGVAVGLGMMTKEPFVFFVAGVIGVALVRGGWRQWRGLIAFALPVLVIAMPWYVNEFSTVQAIGKAAATADEGSEFARGIAPSRLSLENLMWYFWNIVNAQLFAPLFAFSIVGGVWTIVGFARRRLVSPLAWELSIGAFVAWLGITETLPHDTRYGMPLLVYLAVFGSFWIVRLKRTGRMIATGALVLTVVANTLSISFGVGKIVRPEISALAPSGEHMNGPGVVTIYMNVGFLVTAPHGDGDVLGLMRTLKREGIEAVGLFNLGNKAPQPSVTPDFSEAGLVAFAQMARLGVLEPGSVSELTAQDAFLAHGPIAPGSARPCVTLTDGTGVWIWLGNPTAPGVKFYCPLRTPSFYRPSGPLNPHM